MTPEQLRKLCLSLPGCSENIQWGKDRVFKVGEKMFACSGVEKDSLYSFKVDDDRFLELTDLEGVVPAPYLARARWIQIDPRSCSLTRNELSALVKRSHELVLARLSKKAQRAILAPESGPGGDDPVS